MKHRLIYTLILTILAVANVGFFNIGMMSSTSPSALTVTMTGACGGTPQIGGYNWILGPSGQSCTTVCANAGCTCNLSGTRDLVGSGGSLANCEFVLNALGQSTSVTASPYQGTGCIFALGSLGFIDGVPATTCGASHSSDQRVCACDP